MPALRPLVGAKIGLKKSSPTWHVRISEAFMARGASLHFRTIALGGPLGPELLATQLCHLPSTSAARQSLVCTCIHTEDQATILGDQLLQGIVLSYALGETLLLGCSARFLPATALRLSGSCSNGRRCPRFSGCNLRCATCGGYPQPSRGRSNSSGDRRPIPGVHQYPSRGICQVPNAILPAQCPRMLWVALPLNPLCPSPEHPTEIPNLVHTPRFQQMIIQGKPIHKKS